MKRILFLAVCFLYPVFSTIMADNIPITGSWDKDDFIRRSISITPARPVADINGTIVSVCSPDALNNLNIVITDLQGNIVFQHSYSFAAGETISLPALEKGEYIIVLTHYRRYLMGEFEVE